MFFFLFFFSFWLQLFDMKKFQSNVNRELRRAYPDRRRLETQCLSLVAFVKSENDILDCPIWVLVVNVVAMDMLKSKLPPGKNFSQICDYYFVLLIKRFLRKVIILLVSFECLLNINHFKSFIEWMKHGTWNSGVSFHHFSHQILNIYLHNFNSSSVQSLHLCMVCVLIVDRWSYF